MVDLAIISDTLWIATQGGALAWKQGDALPVKFTAVEGLQGNQLTAVATARARPRRGLWQQPRSTISPQPPGHGASLTQPTVRCARDVSALYCDPANEFLVIGYAAHGIDLFDAARDNWQHLDRSSGLATNDVQQVAVVGDRDELWSSQKMA